MAYQARRSKEVYEELELLDENDNVVHCLKIHLDVDTMSRTLNEKYVELVKAEQDIKNLQIDMTKKEKMEQALERVGNAVHDLYEAVFGVENTEIIMEFYKDRMVEMNLEITPFIRDVVIPHVRESVKDSQRRAEYKYTRKKMRENGIFKRVR